MDGCTEKTEALVVGEVLPKKKTISSIYSDVRAKKAARKAEKQGKDNKKRGGGKSKKDADLAFYDYLVKCGFLTSDCYDPFLREQNPYRKGDVIPEVLDLNLYSESGFHFGSKFEPNGFVGKPDHEDGHILCVGPPGSGKTAALVIPSMMTWRGCQIIVDVKGDLYRHWLRLNKHTGKKIKRQSHWVQQEYHRNPRTHYLSARIFDTQGRSVDHPLRLLSGRKDSLF